MNENQMSVNSMLITISDKDIQDLIKTISLDMKRSESAAVEYMLYIFLHFRTILLPSSVSNVPFSPSPTEVVSPKQKGKPDILQIVLAGMFALGALAAVIYLLLK